MRPEELPTGTTPEAEEPGAPVIPIIAPEPAVEAPEAPEAPEDEPSADGIDAVLADLEKPPEPDVTQEETAPKPITVSAAIIREAISLGIDDDIIDSLPADKLEKIVSNRRGQKPASKPVDATSDLLPPKATLDRMDSATRDAVMHLAAAAQRQIDAKTKEVQEIKQASVAQQTRQVEAEVEAGIKALGPKYEAILGKGPSKNLQPGSPQETNRRKLVKLAGALHDSGKLKATNIGDAIAEAAKIGFPRSRGGDQAIARTKSTTNAPQTVDEDSIAFIRSIQAKYVS